MTSVDSLPGGSPRRSSPFSFDSFGSLINAHPILGLQLPQWCATIEVSRLVLLSDFDGFHCFAKGLQSHPLCLVPGWMVRKLPRS